MNLRYSPASILHFATVKIVHPLTHYLIHNDRYSTILQLRHRDNPLHANRLTILWRAMKLVIAEIGGRPSHEKIC